MMIQALDMASASTTWAHARPRSTTRAPRSSTATRTRLVAELKPSHPALLTVLHNLSRTLSLPVPGGIANPLGWASQLQIRQPPTFFQPMQRRRRRSRRQGRRQEGRRQEGRRQEREEEEEKRAIQQRGGLKSASFEPPCQIGARHRVRRLRLRRAATSQIRMDAGITPPASKELVNFDDGAQVQELLERGSPRTRSPPARRRCGKVSYIEAWRVIEKAQTIFGFNGWSSRILDIHKEYEDQNAQTQRWNVGYTCIIRVELKDGTFHDDVGFGSVHNERDRGKAIENARKEAVSDGVKRALRYFGAALGNCVYDKVPSRRRRPRQRSRRCQLRPPRRSLCRRHKRRRVRFPSLRLRARRRRAASHRCRCSSSSTRCHRPDSRLSSNSSSSRRRSSCSRRRRSSNSSRLPRCGLRAARRHRSRSRRRSTMGTTARSVAASRRSVVEAPARRG